MTSTSSASRSHFARRTLSIRNQAILQAEHPAVGVAAFLVANLANPFPCLLYKSKAVAGNMQYPWNRPVEILLVEDDQAACRLMQAALTTSAVVHHLSSVCDGDLALDFLRNAGSYKQAPRPDLIFLDIHMPKKDGRELLTEIKADPVLRRIPVIVLTTSGEQQDVNSMYDLHANCYLRKSPDFDSLCRQIQVIEEFWFRMVLWPSAELIKRRE